MGSLKSSRKCNHKLIFKHRILKKRKNLLLKNQNKKKKE